VTEGADDASAGGEVQLDEDGNEMDQQIRDELRGEQEILVLQPDERLYLRFYRNLTLGLGVALLACMGLVAWVVCNGGLRPSSSVKAALERIQWRRLPTAISAAFSMSLDRDALDPKIAQRLRQVRPRLPLPPWDSSIRRCFLDNRTTGVGMRNVKVVRVT